MQGSNYYNIDDILSEEQAIPCIFQIEAYDLGYLDDNNSSNSIDLPKGSRLNLPFWLAETLARRNFVQIQLPYFFTKSFCLNLLSNPSLNLHDICFYFYEFGVDNKQLSLTLSQTLTERSLTILDKASNLTDVQKYIATLSNLEKILYVARHDCVVEYHTWKNRTSKLIKSSILGKRSRI